MQYPYCFNFYLNTIKEWIHDIDTPSTPGNKDHHQVVDVSDSSLPIITKRRKNAFQEFDAWYDTFCHPYLMYWLNRRSACLVLKMGMFSAAKQSPPEMSSSPKKSELPTRAKRNPANKEKIHFILEQYEAEDETNPTRNPGKMFIGKENIWLY